jgi:hypothetical protein
VVVDEPAASYFRGIRAALSDGWRNCIDDLQPRLTTGSVSIEGWFIDFGDGAIAEQASHETGVVVSHEYSPGYYLVEVTARLVASEATFISLPHAVVGGAGEDPVVIEFKGRATVLIEP